MSIEKDLPPESVVILKGLARQLHGNWKKNHYKQPQDDLVQILIDHADASSLMSQIVVPRLIRRISTIPEEKRKTMDLTFLWKELYGKLEKEGDLNEDYPYTQTQIIEAFLGIQEDSKNSLKTSWKYVTEFGDPLLVTSVIIANNLTDDSKGKLNDPEWVGKFSKGVNLIQDIIIRHMIYAKTKVIPLVGDRTVPTTEKGKDISDEVKKTRALGLGKNPTPEMAAILNPGLAMGEKEQKQYHRELVMLSELITPERNLWHRSVKDAFENAGFAVSSAEVGDEAERGKDALSKIIEKTGDKELFEQFQALQRDLASQKTSYEEKIRKLEKSLEEVQTESNARGNRIKELLLEKKNMVTDLEDLTTKVGDLRQELSKAEAPSEEPEVVVDFASRARVFLIEYLGVKNNIFEFTKGWMELYALEPKNKIFKSYQKGIDINQADDVLRIGLSSLITGNEVIGVRRQSKAYLEPEKKAGRRSTKPNVILTHTELITLWKAKKPKADAPVDTEKDRDLIILKPKLGSEGEKLAEKIKSILENKISSSFPLYRPQLNSNDITTTTTVVSSTRRRIRQRNRTDERVLMW